MPTKSSSKSKLQSKAADRREAGREPPEDFIAAARKKFLLFGVKRTTMIDIGRAVGIPRQSLYEFVSSRNEVVEIVLVRRISEIAKELAQLNGDSFADSIVKTCVGAIRAAKNDPELMNLVSTAPRETVQKVVIGRYQEVHDIVANLFNPILQRGVESGQLRTDKSHDQIVDWLRVVFLAFITQTEIPAKEERQIIAGFVLPSLMFSPDQASLPAPKARVRTG